MIWLLLVVLAGGLVAYLAWQYHQPEDKGLDPEAELRAAVGLHAIRRRLDLADLKHRQRQDAARLKRELAKHLDDKP